MKELLTKAAQSHRTRIEREAARAKTWHSKSVMFPNEVETFIRELLSDYADRVEITVSNSTNTTTEIKVKSLNHQGYMFFTAESNKFDSFVTAYGGRDAVHANLYSLSPNKDGFKEHLTWLLGHVI